MSRTEITVKAIKGTLHFHNITDYRIVRHHSYQHLINFEDQDMTNEYRIKDSFHIYFNYQDGLGYIRVPPCSKGAVKSIISDYVENGYILSNQHIPLGNISAMHEVDVYTDSFSERKYVDEIETEINRYRNENGDVIDAVSHEHVVRRVDFYFPQFQHAQIEQDNFIVLRKANKYGFPAIFIGNTPHFDGMYDSLVNIVGREYASYAELDNALLKGTFVFPPKLFVNIFLQILETLNGEQIASGRGFIKKTQLMTKIFNENITIIANKKKTKNPQLDAEGTFVKEKILVNRGLFVSCFNNIHSSILLKQEAGDASFDYLKDEVCIGTSGSALYCGEIIKKDASMYSVKTVDQYISINSEVGNLSFSFTAKRIGEARKQFSVNMPVIEFFNHIIGEFDARRKIHGYTLPGVVLQF